jgi:xyloglucan-specific exo-beta-1,4-glucanase
LEPASDLEFIRNASIAQPDAGETWSIIPITWTDQTLNNITKIVFHPTNPNHIIALEENEIAKNQ